MEPEKPEGAKNAFFGDAFRVALLFCCVAIGAALRYRACLTEFWLDEIWSVLLLKAGGPGRGAWDIVVNLRHDNNHILNTLYIYFLGDTKNWLLYRLPALFSGTGSILAAYFCARPKKGRAGLFAAFLTTFSFPLILYSSEARGYGPAIFFSLLAFSALQNHLSTGRPAWLWLFHPAAALAALSHSSFIYIFLAMASWSAVEIFSGRANGEKQSHNGGLLNKSLRFSAVNAFPALIFAFLYFAYFRGIKIGGGPHITAIRAASEAAALAVGSPREGILGFIFLVAAFFLTAGSAIRLYYEENGYWVFFISALVLAPALVVIATHPKVIYFRYFVIVIPFFYLLCSLLLNDLWAASGKGRVAAALLLLLFLAGQAAYLIGFFDKGRGSCGRALAFMEENTAGDTIVVGSSDDYMDVKILTFYSQFLRPEKKLFYVSNEDLPNEPPDWFIMDGYAAADGFGREIRMGKNNDYRLAGAFMSSGFSGVDWFIYRRIR